MRREHREAARSFHGWAWRVDVAKMAGERAGRRALEGLRVAWLAWHQVLELSRLALSRSSA